MSYSLKTLYEVSNGLFPSPGNRTLHSVPSGSTNLEYSVRTGCTPRLTSPNCSPHPPQTMTLKDILKKKDKVNDDDFLQHSASPPPGTEAGFRIIRTDTHTEEVIEPPSFDDPEPSQSQEPSQGHHKRISRFRRHSHTSSPIPSSHDSSPAR